MARQKSKKGKGLYAEYKANNTVYKNKLKKLERHCKKFPDDKLAKTNLERIKKDGYTPRSKPLIPGSNHTEQRIKKRKINTTVYSIETAGEQLSRLLGISLPGPKSKIKTIIKHKAKRK